MLQRTRPLQSRGFAKPPERVRQRDQPPGSIKPSQTLHTATYAGATGGAVAKTPSTRSQALRDLAQGEVCTGCCGLVCAAETTVWAHPNGLADNKGRGYKGHDHLGAFLGETCHAYVDRSGSPDALAHFEAAQARTQERLREIAGNIALKPWRVAAARWALEKLGEKP